MEKFVFRHSSGLLRSQVVILIALVFPNMSVWLLILILCREDLNRVVDKDISFKKQKVIRLVCIHGRDFKGALSWKLALYSRLMPRRESLPCNWQTFA